MSAYFAATNWGKKSLTVDLTKPEGQAIAQGLVPFFIALIMVAWGERRVSFIIYNTLIIYGLLLLLFMVVLNAPLPQGNVSPFYDVSAFILRMKTQLDQLL